MVASHADDAFGAERAATSDLQTDPHVHGSEVRRQRPDVLQRATTTPRWGRSSRRIRSSLIPTSQSTTTVTPTRGPILSEFLTQVEVILPVRV